MSTKKPLTSLEDFHPFEVSLVKAGANRKKRFPVWKQEQEMDNFDEVLKSILETELDEEAGLIETIEKIDKAQMSEKGKNAIKAALRILSGFKDEMPKSAMDALAAAAGYPGPKMGQKEDEEGCTMAKVKKDGEGEPIEKGLPEAIQKRLDDSEAENRALKEQVDTITKALEDQKEKSDLAGWVAKAEKELTHFPGKSYEELAKSLHALAKVDPKLADAQFEQMKAASDALKQSEVFKSAGGRGQDATGSAMAKIEEMADALIEKSGDLDITKEKAIAKVLERRPDLYDAYIKESAQG